MDAGCRKLDGKWEAARHLISTMAAAIFVVGPANNDKSANELHFLLHVAKCKPVDCVRRSLNEVRWDSETCCCLGVGCGC